MAEVADLLLQAASGNGGFAGQVDQLVEQGGRNPDGFLLLLGRRTGRGRAGRLRLRWGRFRQRLVYLLPLQFDNLGRAVGLLRASGGASMEVTEPGADRVDGFLQLVVAGGNLLFESLIEATAAVDGLLEQVFQPMAEVAQVVEIGQTGTALEG